jgi:hypothetical protein
VAATCQSSGVSGNGQITRTTRTANGFRSVRSDLAGFVSIRDGANFQVQVETDSNTQDLVTTNVDGAGVLVLGIKPGVTVCMNVLKILVAMPDFRGANLTGVGEIDITKTTASSDVSLELSGSGNIGFSGIAARLGIVLSGAGNVLLDSGSASSTDVFLSGVGNVNRNTFSPGRVSPQVTGAGFVNL